MEEQKNSRELLKERTWKDVEGKGRKRRFKDSRRREEEEKVEWI
jgi:hypothetical protein